MSSKQQPLYAVHLLDNLQQKINVTQNYQNPNQWKNVQSIIKKTIQQIFSLFINHNDRIHHLENFYKKKKNKQSNSKNYVLNSQLLSLLNENSRINMLLNDKPSFQDIKDIVNNLIQKPNVSIQLEVNDDNRIFRNQLKKNIRIQITDQIQCNKYYNRQQIIYHDQYDFKNYGKQIQTLKKGLKKNEIDVTSIQTNILQKINQQSKKIQYLNQNINKIKKQKKYKQIKQELKKSNQQINENLNKINQKLSLQTSNQRLNLIENKLETISKNFNQKLVDLGQNIHKKIVQVNLQSINKDTNNNNNKIIKKQQETCLNLIIAQLQNHTQSIQSLRKQLTLKANVKQFSQLISRKTGILFLQDVYQIQKIVKKFSQNKSQIKELNNVKDILKDQRLINESFYGQNTMAKWLWLSGQFYKGMVPWDIQIKNYSPELIIWKQSSHGIKLLKSGFYRVALCFMTTKQYILNIFINGELISNISKKEEYSKMIQTLLRYFLQWLINHWIYVYKKIVNLVNKAQCIKCHKTLSMPGLSKIYPPPCLYKHGKFQKISNTTIIAKIYCVCGHEIGIEYIIDLATPGFWYYHDQCMKKIEKGPQKLQRIINICQKYDELKNKYVQIIKKVKQNQQKLLIIANTNAVLKMMQKKNQ